MVFLGIYSGKLYTCNFATFVFVYPHVRLIVCLLLFKGNLHLLLNRPDLAVTDFRGAQELRADLRSYQGILVMLLILKIKSYHQSNTYTISGLVRAYLALSKCKDALFTAREAMKVMHQSAKALKLVGDVHAISSSGREKVIFIFLGHLYLNYILVMVS